VPSEDPLANALYHEFGMNLNPANPERYWRFAADGIRRRWLADHDALVRADEREKCARIAEKGAARWCRCEDCILRRATAAAIRSQITQEDNHG
jgi:hypothetical protein